MKNNGKVKRALAALLTVAMCISCMPLSAFAAEPDLSPEALRVSDEFAAKYPNGLLDIVNQNTITNEDSGEIKFYIARRGGTEGEVDVSVKAIEMTAKYGEDFVFVEEGLFSSREVEKKLDTPTLLESSIADYGDEPVTVEGVQTDANSESVTDTVEENAPKTEENTNEANDNAENSTENGEVANETVSENREATDEIVPEAIAAENSVKAANEETQPADFDGNRKYSSSLHKMRDEILGKSTKAEATADTDLTRLFTVENKDDVMRDEAMSAVMPGAFINLHFNEGENYKIVTVKIIDDDIVEDDEAFMIGLYDCKGAELGNNITSNVCIKDNDERTEDTELYFEEANVSAYNQNSTVRLKLMRSNNLETYQLLNVQTMALTAKADTNYSSLVTETVLLAGQEYKYIDIPIKRADISEPVDFEVRVSGGKCSDVSATVTIYPADSGNDVSLMSDDVSLFAANDQPKAVIEGKSYNNSSYADSGRLITYKNSAGYTEGGVELNADRHRWGYLYYDLDLRGIEKIKVKAEGTWADTKYPSRVQHEIYIEGGGKTVSKQKNWGPEEFTFNSNEFAHKQTRLAAHADSKHHNDTRLWIHKIELYKQQIVLSFEQPETFKLPIYKNGYQTLGYYTENGNEKVVAPQASISALNKDSSRPSKYYRDDTLTLTSSLSADGKKYGAYLKGYELYNPATQKYTYFSGTELKLTPDVIGTYVYGDNKNYASTLKIKPVYERKSVESKLNFGNFAEHKGSISIGGETIKPNAVKEYRRLTGYTNVLDIDVDTWRTKRTIPWISVEDLEREEKRLEGVSWFWKCGEDTYETAQWKVGDYIAVTLKPADGYTASAINDANGNKISEGTSNTMYVQLKESGNCIVPVFNRNDCGVTFFFEGNTDGLYVFHDKKTNADKDFLNLLYNETSGLTNWTNDTTPVFTGLLNNKIRSNYDILRKEQKLDGQKLSNLAIGDVVTVYAEAPDGYIPYWYIDDGQKTITTENDKIYARHYGNSFSFEMSSNDVTLKCGMEKKTAENYVMTGKLVKPSQTLKGKGYSQVNPKIADSYMAIPGSALSVLNFDERKDSAVIDGVKYYTSVTTDKDGNFKMYIPNVSEREYFSVKYNNGVQTKATTLLAANGKTYYIVVPANDVNYTVKSIDCRTMLGDLAETNGLIKIPYQSEGANRSFLVNTVCSNEKYIIGAAYINSYRSDGSPVTSISMKENYSGGLETSWRADVNIAEILTDGGRITVELFDKNGVSRGEVETGYTLEKELQPVALSVSGMPDKLASQDSVDIPVVGSNVPIVPGSKFTEQPNDKTMEIAVGQGETLQEAIYAQLEAFDNSDNMSKLMYLTKYVSPDAYSVNVRKDITETKKENGEASDETRFPIMFDFGMYMKLDKNEDGTLSLNYIFVTVGLSAVYTSDWHAIVCGIPLYITLSAGGSVRGLFGINGTNDYFSDLNVYNKEFYALLGKYGSAKIENKNYSVKDENDQKLFAALYAGVNLSKDQLPKKDELIADFDKDKEKEIANAIDKLFNRYSFYYANKEIFEANASEFSGDLNNRILMYQQLVDEEDADKNGSSCGLSEVWMHKFNMLLVIESLPEYLNIGKSVYDISKENYFGFGDGTQSDLDVTGIVSLRPSFSIGAGVGVRGILSVGVSGHLDFIINWQPWEEAKGTVTFALNADIDLYIIPLSVRLVGYTVKMFETSGYLPNDFDKEAEGGSGVLLSLMSLSDTETYSSVNTAPKRRTGDNTLKPKDDISLFASYDDGLKYVDITQDYQTETTKHPQPNMFLLPNGNKLIVYMNDNLDRGLYDRNSVYYSVFDKTTEEWSEAAELEEDGTLDGDIETMQLSDGRVIVVWTNGDRTFGNDLPDMADLVTSQNISLCVFDAEGKPGEICDITNLKDYGYSEPALSYNDGTLTIAYKITDYHTDGAEFDYDDIEKTYQSFMTNSYESLAITEFDLANSRIINDNNPDYTLFEQTNDVDLNGMRFVNADMGGLENPKLYDIKAAAFKGKTYFVYSVDTDNNSSTKNDRDLFCIIRENGTNSKPIRLTDNNINDANVNIVVNDMMNKIYFGSGSKISTIDLEAITESNWEDKGSYCVMKNAQDQTDSVLEYASEEAADGFKIFTGGNGVLYMLWTEFSTRDEAVPVQEDSQDKKKVTHKTRALYMKTYDPKFIESEYEDEESGTQTIYTGAWGLTNEILSETDKYINEPYLAVNANNEYTVAYRLFEMENKTDNNVAYEKEADTSTLCVSDFELVSSVSAAKTNQYPLYPREGETVTLDFECENYGTIPSDKLQFNYYIETDADIEGYDELNDCWWSKGDGVNSAAGKSFAVIKDGTGIEKHIISGANLSDTVQFVMPKYNKEVSIWVLAWEDDITEMSKSKIPVTVTPELEASELQTTLSDDERELTIQGSIRNIGNYPAENIVLSLYADGTYDAANILFDNEKATFDKEAVNQVVGKIEIPSLAPDEVYSLNYSIVSENNGDTDNPQLQAAVVKKSKLPGKYFTNDGKATFTVSAEYDGFASEGNDATLFATIRKKSKKLGNTSVKKNKDTIPSLKNINIDIPSEGDEVSLFANDAMLKVPVGEQKELNVTLEPYGSAKGYSLVYESADNSVAEINSSNGKITGVGEGKTTVTVKAVKNDSDNIVLVDSAGDFWLNDGNPWNFANDTETSGGEVVMAKEISVEVTPTEVKPSPKPSHSGGRGGSSVKPTVTPDPVKPENPVKDKQFADVSENAWYYDAVKYAFENGLMLGISDNEFAPESQLTRAMFVTVLYRIENEPDMSSEILGYPFEDVDSESWYTDAVYWARKNGIVNGITDNEFAPNDNITREQMAAIIFRYAKYKNIAPTDNWAIKLDYADLEEISDWAAEAVMYCKLKGLMQGKDNNMFDPKNSATRAETAAILQRLTENKYTSRLGYSMTYNPTAFTLDDSGDHDTFVFNSNEKTDAPIYITVQPYTDFDVKTAVDGLILQSGRDDVKATEAYFGADSIKTQSVYIEKDVNGIKQIQAFYVIPVGSGSMIVEIGSFVGTEAKTDAKIEEMLGTFSLKETK